MHMLWEESFCREIYDLNLLTIFSIFGHFELLAMDYLFVILVSMKVFILDNNE